MNREDFLKYLMESKYGNVKAFSHAIGIPYTTIRSILERGVGKAQVDNVIKICNGLGISPEQIATDFIINEAISKTIATMNALDENRQKEVYYFATKQMEEQKSNILHFEDFKEEPIQAVLSAGKGIMNYYEAEKTIVRVSIDAPEHDWIFLVSGDSMEPLFEDGDIVFVDEFDSSKETIQNGRIYVVEIDGEAFIKKIYKDSSSIRLVSLNKEYKDIEVRKENIISVIGRVII